MSSGEDCRAVKSQRGFAAASARVRPGGRFFGRPFTFSAPAGIMQRIREGGSQGDEGDGHGDFGESEPGAVEAGRPERVADHPRAGRLTARP